MSKGSQKSAGLKAKARRSRSTKTLRKATSSPQSAAPFAVASDGTLLINVTAVDALSDADLEGRTLFIGATLTEEEQQLAHDGLENAAQDLRGRIAGRLAKRAVGATRAPEPKAEPDRRRE